MALDTYANLQTALISALHRNGLSTQVPDFITLCESRLNKKLRIRAMRSRVTASASAEYVALPTGFLSMANFQLNTSPRHRIEYASPEWLDIRYADSTATGEPVYYTFVGGEIQLAPVPDTTYTLEMDYYKKWDIATDSTNWLLTNAPNCYYYGSLMEAAMFLVNDKRVPMWEMMFNKAIQEVEDADDNDEQPDFGLQVRPDGATP